MKAKTLLAAISAAVIAFALLYLQTGPLQTQADKIVFEVYYSPDCGCCGEYVDYLRSSEADVRVKPT
jgi:hypothetical protein